ncbi:hypothetical protein [Pandoraea commovens]|uniref:hypothetical protein n=1 Tax=Pandoraea commovens TaxID=2508289 RepID=UPI001242C469|nr:hypothetical protein [Pandoraea commovens]
MFDTIFGGAKNNAMIGNVTSPNLGTLPQSQDQFAPQKIIAQPASHTTNRIAVFLLRAPLPAVDRELRIRTSTASVNKMCFGTIARRRNRQRLPAGAHDEQSDFYS